MLLEIEQLSKTYNPGLMKKKVQALRSVSFDVGQGEVLGLIGPNGAGKSTTVRLVLGLMRPDSGSIRYRGKSMKELDLRAKVGYLPENPYLYDHLNLKEVLSFAGRTTGMSRGEIRQKSPALVKQVGLEGMEKRPLRSFSKGMLQRAGLCCALLHDPEMLILDEPMSGLDPLGRKMVFDIIMDLKKQGCTILFCSHILSDVERLCDRIALLHEGRLVRSFEREEFGETSGLTFHIVVNRLNAEQRTALAEKGIQVNAEAEKEIVSVSQAQIQEAVTLLTSMGVEVLGSRSERVSLEALFVNTIKGVST